MTNFREYELARITRPLDITCDGTLYHLETGTEGTIVHILSEGKAYIVEFSLEPGKFDSNGEFIEYPLQEIAVLENDCLEPVQ